MRDLLLLVMFIGVIPSIFRHPWIGIIVWVIVSVMNPHRLAYGFMYDLPIAFLVAVITLISMVISREQKQLPTTLLSKILLVITIWVTITYLFALYPQVAHPQWVKVMKILFMTFVGMTLLHTKQHLYCLLWAIVFSLAFYGIKGGIFTLMTGGSYRVYGPPYSDVTDNNAISFALVMVLPLMYYLSSSVKGRREKLVKWGWYTSIALSTFAILASHSRGAFLALAAMTLFLWLKSNQKLKLGIAIGIAIPILIGFMPEEWSARMSTIQTYDQDASSMGRINTWWMTFNLANAHPILGGGFQIYEPESFAKWAPDPTDIHAAHSIFFAALGEHGYVGLLLFLTLWITTWRTGSTIIRKTKGQPGYEWAENMARMLQVSLIGYIVGGAFLSVLYFDVIYYLIMCMSLLLSLVEIELKPNSQAASNRALAASH